VSPDPCSSLISWKCDYLTFAGSAPMFTRDLRRKAIDQSIDRYSRIDGNPGVTSATASKA